MKADTETLDEISGFLDQGTGITGELHFAGRLRLDGDFHGSISAEGTLVVGQDALVHADIKVAEIQIAGKIFGNIEAAPILTIGSGRPVDPMVGFDANHNGAFPLSSRPLGMARNSLSTSNQVQLDLRLLKYFKIGEHGKLDLVAESFNLLNHTNVIGLNQVFGGGATPMMAFATANKASNARQIQFSIDFEF